MATNTVRGLLKPESELSRNAYSRGVSSTVGYFY